jgi:predicted RNA-binding protein YlqC (UPF0109 family)
MQQLLEHLLLPIVQHPEDLDFAITEGESSVLIEMKLNSDDEALLLEDDSAKLFSIRHILSIASGSKKPSLEIVSGSPEAPDEEAEAAEAPEAAEVPDEEVETPEETSPEDSPAE